MKVSATLSLLMALVGSTLITLDVNAKTETPLDHSFYQKVVSNQARPSADQQKDKSRLPQKLLAFMQLKPGMVVFEQGASGGYTTELLARTVGKSGEVYAEGLDSSRFLGGRLPQVKALERGLIYQIPERAAKAGLKPGNADRVVLMFTYHDLALNSRIDRNDFLTNLKDLLKSGGSIIIGDNAAVKGSGLDYTRQLHRIDPEFIIKEFTAAGFKLDATSDIYHNGKDDLKAHWRFLAKPRHHHRLLMRFTKP
jgi:predicted methyltransferase